MIKLTQIFICAILCSLSFALVAEEALPAKYLEQIIGLQRRADKLAYGDLGSSNYHLAKARAWLDMAASEYHQVDTSGVMIAAIAQAETLLTALENNQSNISTAMPMDFPGSEKVRPDLWEKITSIKSKGNYTCGQHQLAEGEVQLVWAGHEKIESGWSHADSYARIAENSIAEAQVAINICNAVPSATSNPVASPVASNQTVVIPAMTPSVSASPIEKITLSGDALFALGKSTLNPAALPSLDELADKIKKISSLDSISLIGHTDRLRPANKPDRNQKLSEQRAETVKQYLAGKGIATEMMHSSGAGATQPLVQCTDKKINKNKKKLAACLQPNRRVEILLSGVK
jgi:outer membrane protein OmpA-like peptidoglycan-associated protein